MQKGFKDFILKLQKLSLRVYKELGDGFDEDLYQRGLAYEFRKAKVKYMRETNIETFYKDQMLALRELDFLIPAQKHKSFAIKKPIIIETKYSSKIVDAHRAQLRQYLKSIPKNGSDELTEVDHGVLLNWQKTNQYEEKRVTSDVMVEIEVWKYSAKGDMELIESHQK